MPNPIISDTPQPQAAINLLNPGDKVKLMIVPESIHAMDDRLKAVDVTPVRMNPPFCLLDLDYVYYSSSQPVWHNVPTFPNEFNFQSVISVVDGKAVLMLPANHHLRTIQFQVSPEDDLKDRGKCHVKFITLFQ
jgi:hypothetical protein